MIPLASRLATFIVLSLPILSVAFADSLTATKSDRAETAKRGREALIGLSVEDLIACAGDPLQMSQENGKTHLLYAAGGDAIRRISIESVRRYQYYCEVRFVINGDTVSEINYSGRTGKLTSRGEQCAYVVAPCMNK